MDYLNFKVKEEEQHLQGVLGLDVSHPMHTLGVFGQRTGHGGRSVRVSGAHRVGALGHLLKILKVDNLEEAARDKGQRGRQRDVS